MQAAIGYLRVSTQEQGRSGLGLAAQRNDIEAFGVRAKGSSSKPGTRMYRRGLVRTRCCFAPDLRQR
jgi:DNA invertase Pin-like site-specific DNA recombinase